MRSSWTRDWTGIPGLLTTGPPGKSCTPTLNSVDGMVNCAAVSKGKGSWGEICGTDSLWKKEGLEVGSRKPLSALAGKVFSLGWGLI